MKREDLYDNVVASLIRFVEDFREVEMPTATYLNWDAHAQISELPQADVIGLAGVGFAQDESNKFDIACGIQISTHDDASLTRMTRLVSKLYGKLWPGSSLTVYDHDQVEPNTFMVVALPTAVLPVGRAETRSVQALEIRLLLDPGAASSLR